MLLFAVLCQTLIDTPADALQPVNRSEIAILAEREAKIEGLEWRLREIEHSQPIHRRGPYSPKVLRHPGGQRPNWQFQWLQTNVRWESTGDFALHQPTSLGTTEPQPHRIRGTWRPAWNNWDWPARMELDSGSDIVEYWFAPPVDYWSDPLEHGMILGTESFRLPPAELSIFEAIEDLFPDYFGWDQDRLFGGFPGR